MNLVSLSEELATFIKMVSNEKGWRCRMTFNSNATSCEINIMMPNIGELFVLSDVVVRVSLGAVGMCRLNNFGCFTLHANGIELFKSKNGFDNHHL